MEYLAQNYRVAVCKFFKHYVVAYRHSHTGFLLARPKRDAWSGVFGLNNTNWEGDFKWRRRVKEEG